MQEGFKVFEKNYTGVRILFRRFSVSIEKLTIDYLVFRNPLKH